MVAKTRESYCFTQVQRLSGLSYYPGKDGIRELVAALAANTLTDFHAAAVVDEWLQDQSVAPAPADIRRIALALRPIYAPQPGEHEACTSCAGTGWLVCYEEYKPFVRHGHCRYHVRDPHEADMEFGRRMRHYEREIMPEGRILSEAVMRCSCAAGLARARRDVA
jgi:hypothetical protein